MILFGMGNKGDVERYILWTVVLLLLLVIALVLLYTGAYNVIENLLINQLK